ncbi:MAG TPA: hypothetical protein VF782_04660 [Allosphingosinicella sp.]|jgi:hypothetical protein
MDHLQSARALDATSAATKAEWTAPHVDKLIAGGAKAGPGQDVEGVDGTS